MRPLLALLATSVFAVAVAHADTAANKPPAAPPGDSAERDGLAAACDAASGMPKGQIAATPDGGLEPAAGQRYDDMLQAIVASCGKAAEAAPLEGRFHHRLGLALAKLKRSAEAVAAFQRAMAAGYAGGYDEISSARMFGGLAPAVPASPELGVAVANEGIAKTGSPEIKRDLALFLLTTRIARDPARARKLLEEAVADHHVPAMVDLAALLTRDGGAADRARARELIDEAIAAHSRTAEAARAEALRSDTPEKARDLFAQAAEHGHIRSMIALATMLRAGEGGDEDIPGARRWLAKASGMGDIEARRRLANSLLHDEPKQEVAGVTLLTAAAEAGSLEATYHLGDIYKDGLGVGRDSAKSMIWFRKAAEAGSGKAMERIGSMYDYGEGVAIDHAEARRWYDKAIAKGENSALTDIGMQYDHAMGVPRDVVAALAWYRKGAEAGVPTSLSNVGYAYEAGRGVKRDYAEAIKWYQKAVDLDDSAAAHNLANMYLDGKGVKKDRVRGLTLMQRAAELREPTALNDLALLERGRPGGSPRRATELLREAAALKCKEAYLNLGQALKEGWDGRPDFVEANVWFKKAIDNPSDLNPNVLAEAQYQLAANLIQGRGIDRDVPRGTDMMRRAAAGGNREARAFLALRSGAERGRSRRR